MSIEHIVASITSKALRFVGAVAAKMQEQRGSAAQPPEPRVYRVSVVRGEKDPPAAKFEELDVRATSPEDAAERRCGALSDQLFAMGKFRSRSYQVLVDEQPITVNAALLIKTEAVRRDGGPKWGS